MLGESGACSPGIVFLKMVQSGAFLSVPKYVIINTEINNLKIIVNTFKNYSPYQAISIQISMLARE